MTEVASTARPASEITISRRLLLGAGSGAIGGLTAGIMADLFLGVATIVGANTQQSYDFGEMIATTTALSVFGILSGIPYGILGMAVVTWVRNVTASPTWGATLGSIPPAAVLAFRGLSEPMLLAICCIIMPGGAIAGAVYRKEFRKIVEAAEN